MFYVRPIAGDDLPAVLALSERTGTGLTSLPANRERLRVGDGEVHLSGRTRHNKLVHLAGGKQLLGGLVIVRVDHAGPYSLRGSLA